MIRLVRLPRFFLSFNGRTYQVVARPANGDYELRVNGEPIRTGKDFDALSREATCRALQAIRASRAML